jgi:23S rRNA pseudouridine2604 synthase
MIAAQRSDMSGTKVCVLFMLSINFTSILPRTCRSPLAGEALKLTRDLSVFLLVKPSVPIPKSNEPIRISKVLAQRGIASRSEADRMIEKGWVKIDGRVVASGDRALPDAEIVLSPEAKQQLQSTITVVLNKPRGFTSAPDEFGGAPAMSLLTAENYSPVGTMSAEPPRLPSQGLRVAGRMSSREMGLVILTTDTALARRLAADDVRETWQIDFRGAPPADAVETLIQALHDSGAVTVSADPTNANALLLTSNTLAKGILSSICDGKEWRTDITRITRGEVSLADVAPRHWRILG